MKLRNLFMAVVAGAAMLVGCNKEVDLGPAKVALDQTTLTFEAAGGSQEVSLTSSRDWTATGIPDWIALSATNGKAAVEAQPLKITVTQNTDYDRSATIIFTIGFARTSLAVKQAGPNGEIDNGDGTLENPFNVAGVIEYVNELGADVNSPKKVFVAGIVSAVDEEFTTNYGNGSFKISDDGETTGAQFTAYRVLYLGNKKFTANDTQVKVGDKVIVYGNVVNYKGNTPETQQNSAFLYSLNGVDKGGAEGGSGETGEAKGTGTAEDPFNVAGAINAVKDLTWTSTTEYDKVGPYYVKGIVKSVTEAYGTQYGNGTFYIKDAETDNEFYVYRALYLGNKKFTANDTQIAEGDEVVIYGELMNYRGNTPETVLNSAFLYSLNGNTGSGDTPGETGEAKGTGTLEDPFNVAGAINAVKDLTWTSTTEYDKVGPYYVKGIVKSIKEAYGTQYGNGTFYIKDAETDNEFYVFRALYLGNKKFADGDTALAEGDEVVIYGELMNYRGNTPETVQNSCYLYSLNGNTGSGDTPGDTPGETGEAKGTGTQADPFNVAGAINAVKNLTWTSKTEFDKVGPYYVKGKIASIKYTYSAQYGTATFDISDEGGTDKFTCYSVKYFGGEAWVEGNTQVAVGDEVIIYGELQNYQGNTPETVSGAYVYSLNGKTSDEQTPGGDDPVTTHAGTLEDPFTVADAVASVANLTWTSKTEFDKVGPYYVKGKIASIKYTYSAQYGTATFDISDEGGTDKFTCYSVKYFGGEAWVEGNTQVAVGDEVIIYGELQNYQGNTPETVSGAYVYSLNGKTSDEQTPGGNEPEGGIYASSVTWTLGNKAYSEKAIVNDVENVPVLKLGNSSTIGTATLTIPSGATKITFYAVSWSGKPSKLVFKNGDTELGSVSPAANTGLANTSPYTLTVTDADKYEIAVSGATSITVQTDGSNKRAALFAIVSE